MAKWGKGILLLLLLGWCVFIWHFSFATGTESVATSGSILQTVNAFFERIGLPLRLSSTFVRKTAHFVEFAVLGVLSCLTLSAWHVRPSWAFSLLIPPVVGGIDETIQRFSAGRGSSVLDVLLDTTGGFCGIAAVCVLFALIAAHRRKAAGKGEEEGKS